MRTFTQLHSDLHMMVIEPERESYFFTALSIVVQMLGNLFVLIMIPANKDIKYFR